jgi:RNA polymerase primary sigma factor
MSILNELTSTAVEAVDTLRTKATEVVVDVRKQLTHLPQLSQLTGVEPKKVQAAVVETATAARKQVVDLTAPATKTATKTLNDLTERGEKIVRDLTGRPVHKPVAKRTPAAKKATAAKRTVARKTTAAKRTVKKAAAGTTK